MSSSKRDEAKRAFIVFDGRRVVPVVATLLPFCCWFCCQFLRLKLLAFNNVVSVASFQTSYANRYAAPLHMKRVDED